jgi:hypothetical protein
VVTGLKVLADGDFLSVILAIRCGQITNISCLCDADVREAHHLIDRFSLSEKEAIWRELCGCMPVIKPTPAPTITPTSMPTLSIPSTPTTTPTATVPASTTSAATCSDTTPAQGSYSQETDTSYIINTPGGSEA